MLTLKRLLYSFAWIACAAMLLGTTEVKEPVAAGVGLQVVPTERGEVVVLAVLPGSPAGKAGLIPGDLILQVDGQRLAGTDFMAITVHLLRGKAGTTVELAYQRPGVFGTFSVVLERKTLLTAPVEIPGVEMRP